MSVVSFFQRKGILGVCFGLGLSSRGPLCTPYLIWCRTALSHHGLLCKCTERHRHCPRPHSKSMLMPRARPSCLSPHLLGSALEEVGGLHGDTGRWALCCDYWDVNTLTATVVWGSQEHSSHLRTPSPRHLLIYLPPAQWDDSQVAWTERDGGILEGRLLGLTISNSQVTWRRREARWGRLEGGHTGGTRTSGPWHLLGSLLAT